MKKLHKIIALKSEEPSPLIHVKLYNLFQSASYYGKPWEDMYDEYVHLYLLSDETIQVGDYYEFAGAILKFKGSSTGDPLTGRRKVIACTDKQLELPGFSERFINNWALKSLMEIEIEYDKKYSYTRGAYENPLVVKTSKEYNVICTIPGGYSEVEKTPEEKEEKLDLQIRNAAEKYSKIFSEEEKEWKKLESAFVKGAKSVEAREYWFHKFKKEE